MNELQEELKFFFKEIGLYNDWVDCFKGLINIRESLETTDTSDSPNNNVEFTLNKLKSLLGQLDPFKTNSEEKTETYFTEDVSKSFKEVQQEDLGSTSGGCSSCETTEEDTKTLEKITDSTKHQVDPANLDDLFEEMDISYDKKCTRNMVTGKYTLCDIFEIPEESSLPFEEAVTSLLLSLNNLGSSDVIKTLDNIMEDIKKIVLLSPEHEHYYSRPSFDKDTLKIGYNITKVACDTKAEDIVDLVLEIGREQSDLPVSADVEMVQCLIPAITPIRNYIHKVHSSYHHRSYSSIIYHVNALEKIYKTYCKHQTLITSMKQEDILLEYEKIADSIALLKKINRNMCVRIGSESDYRSDSDEYYFDY